MRIFYSKRNCNLVVEKYNIFQKSIAMYENIWYNKVSKVNSATCIQKG